jgi:hypothetical protein
VTVKANAEMGLEAQHNGRVGRLQREAHSLPAMGAAWDVVSFAEQRIEQCRGDVAVT